MRLFDMDSKEDYLLDGKYKVCAPLVDAVQGEWIEHKGKWVDFDFYPTKYECNQCHYYVDEGYDSIFCPNCGARMKGGEE